MTDHVIRFVATVPSKDGIGRTLMLAAQGRNTHATPDAAQAWIDAYLADNSSDILDHFGRDVQVRPCKCYPGHFDPMGVWFDVPEGESDLERSSEVKGQAYEANKP